MSGGVTELQLDGNGCIVLDGFCLVIQVANTVLNNQIENAGVVDRIKVSVTGVRGGNAVAAHADRTRRKAGGECSAGPNPRCLAYAIHGYGDSTGRDKQIQLDRSADARRVANRHRSKRIKMPNGTACSM